MLRIKTKKLLTTLSVFFALALTACSAAPAANSEGEPAKSNGEAISQPASAPAASSAKASSSKHTHTAAEGAQWQSDASSHWHDCVENDGGKVDRANHDFEKVEAESTDATCAAAGVLVQVCKVCGYKKTTNLDQLTDHTFGPLEVKTAATCLEGVAEHVCSGCNKVESVAILPTQEHTWGAVTVEHTAEDGEVTETYETCPICGQTRISWNAQDANKVASSGFNSSGKFGASGDYVSYKFYSPKALKARLWVKIANRSGSSDSPYNRETKTGNQAIWYDYYNGPEFKYTVAVNDVVVNQNSQADVLIGEEVVPMSEYMYSDFLPEGANELVAPWFTFETVAGMNTLRIERTLGYSVSVKDFFVIGA